MEMSPVALVFVALLLAAWTVGAALVALTARARERASASARANVRRMARMIETSPAVPLLVRSDGRIEGPQRLAAWLGLDELPGFLSELREGGIPEAAIEELREAVRRTQKTAAPFRMEVAAANVAAINGDGSGGGGAPPMPGGRSLAVFGQLADPAIAPGGAALLWWFDFSESRDELARLRVEAAEARADFSALVGIIEAAPVPMWFRGPDMKLRLVNRAYVQAVREPGSAAVVERQVELVEPVDGLTPAAVARHALEEGQPVARIVQATLGSQRRTVRVSDLPLAGEGVAGFAVDIEEQEEQSRALRGFREAQRSMLDCLSIGVAQFDAEHRLSFANQHFRRLFALPDGAALDALEFDRFLDLARVAGRLPEVRDFPVWRRELGGWFTASEPVRDDWALAEGMHLKVVAQPMPDGSLVLLVEDRSEQLALSAIRDTLLRTRAAMFDALAEGVAVVAPDGRIQLWNRRFSELWELPGDFFEGHPRIEALVERVGERLARPAQRGAIDEVVREATLDRKRRSGQVLLADGRTLRLTGVPLPDGNGLLTTLDITANKRAEDAMRDHGAALEGALEEADAARDRLLEALAREVSGPLAVLRDYAEARRDQLAERSDGHQQDRDAGGGDEHADDPLAGIDSAIDHLARQVERALEQASDKSAPHEPIELLPFVTALVRSRAGAIETRRLSLDLRGDRGSGTVDVDGGQLGHAIGQLLDLAIANTQPRGRILVTLARPGQGARIVISDNGEGLKPADLARALDGRRLEPVVGVGLPLVRRMIEALGGRLELRSERRGGTTASIFLS